jgi:hypothetical protein
MTTTYDLPLRASERGWGVAEPVTYHASIAFLIVAGAGAAATYLDRRMQLFSPPPLSAPIAGGPPLQEAERVAIARRALAASERPSEALFKTLAIEDPQTLVVWSQRPDLPRGLVARAAEALGQVVDDEVAVPALMALLEKDDLVVKEGALHGLASHPTPEVRARIRAVINDLRNHAVIREIAAEVLDELSAD